jgi:hypothetical protein
MHRVSWSTCYLAADCKQGIPACTLVNSATLAMAPRYSSTAYHFCALLKCNAVASLYSWQHQGVLRSAKAGVSLSPGGCSGRLSLHQLSHWRSPAQVAAASQWLDAFCSFYHGMSVLLSHLWF